MASDALTLALIATGMMVAGHALAVLIGPLSERVGAFLLWLKADALKHEIRKREAAR